MMAHTHDISRLKLEYASRARRLAGGDAYSVFNPSNLFALHSRQRAALAGLRAHGLLDLSGLRILEMGCGAGGVLTEYLGFGVNPQDLFEVDLLPSRLDQVRLRLPASNFYNANGASLPFPSGSFDLMLQYTALSSLLDTNRRREICQDMLRVLKPGGLILSYDFWLNPLNKHTRCHPLRDQTPVQKLFL